MSLSGKMERSSMSSQFRADVVERWISGIVLVFVTSSE